MTATGDSQVYRGSRVVAVADAEGWDWGRGWIPGAGGDYIGREGRGRSIKIWAYKNKQRILRL